MFRGDWLPFTVLGGGLIAGIIAVILILYAVPIHGEQYRADTSNYQNADIYNDQPFPYILLPPIAVPRSQYTTKNEQQYSTNLRSDHDGGGIRWTDVAIVILTLGLVIFSGLQWSALRNQVRQLESAVQAEIKAGETRTKETEHALTIAGTHAQAALEQAGASHRAADAAVAGQRPWIKIDIEPASELKDDGRGGIKIRFNAKLENIGAIPATNLQARVGMACGATSYKKAVEQIPPTPNEFGTSLFPNEPIEIPLFGRITAEEIATAPNALGNFDNREIGVVVIASVIYRFAGGEGRSTRAYWLFGPGSSGLKLVVDFDNLPVPLTSINMMKVPVQDTTS
jgi:hypothetical protein